MELSAVMQSAAPMAFDLAGAASAAAVDEVFPVQSGKPGILGMSSDCCGSNNYPEKD